MNAEAAKTLLTALRELRATAGFPSVHSIARKTRGQVSQSAVNAIMRGQTKTPRWATLAVLIEALGGNPQEYVSLYTEAYDDSRGLSTPDTRESLTSTIQALITSVDRLAEEMRQARR